MISFEENRNTVHTMVDAAAKDYNDIDLRRSNQLNLVDILAYEKNGPQQKQIGQFLEHNFDALRGLSTNESGTHLLSLKDLQETDFLTSGNKNQVAEIRNLTAESAAFKTASAEALVGAVAVGGVALLFGPETLVVSAPLAAGFAGVAGLMQYSQTEMGQRKMQDVADSLHP